MPVRKMLIKIHEALDESGSTMEDKTPIKRAFTSLSILKSTPLSLETSNPSQSEGDGQLSTNREKHIRVKKQKFQLLED
ncbi:hypothetical protein PIB30_017824 [Stylosanthes scabra]|uniref:Uncharacterized protein n=1 Tax=Stylosanthes scabra TaxID=79078 RepID=A0ABU6V5Y6_9FABA|nr:hypothetical protein [Stylosanthes scabra]